MTDREPTIFAMGGGGFTSTPGDPALDALVLELCRDTPEPRVLFLPTASGDPREQIAAFHATFGDRCRATHLSLFRLHGSKRPLRDVVLSQDAVYVGGGSMRNMLAIWRAHGLDGILHEAWERGIVLAGLSAGAMCWFEGGVTMSGGPPEPYEGLGFLSGSLSVHADGEPARLPVYLESVKSGRLPGGWACDDGVGLVLKGDTVERIVSARPGSTALRVDAVGGELVRRRHQPELLGVPVGPERVVPDDIREFRAMRHRGGR
ncbi:peptidase E [Conexibacter sp. SYSU D00693]|uniref:Type 1 glutamine amidotransferase-like domain-containing protein n=1 Tax=Conexibacter sp. SYSU D00693 TaxID=2812560 RepID=UPI00196AE482|nr:peptidase E [Conexibacter sp. SYSU D00693]